MVRPAREDDLPALLEIENEVIENGFAHFGIQSVTLDEARFAFHAALFPVGLFQETGNDCGHGAS